MEITRHPAGNLLTLALKGRLDGSWSEHTTDALTATLEEGWHHLRLDLSGITFLSSAGIRTLMVHYKKLTALQGSLGVVSPSEAVRTVLETAGLQTLLTTAAPTGERRTSARSFEGGSVESYPLAPGARLRAALLHSHDTLCLPPNRLALGLGTLGGAPGESFADEPGTSGEFLALAGVALAQPADGRQSVDYLLTQGALQPRVLPHSGLVAEGGAEGVFSHCLRFESADPQQALPLSALLHLALRETEAEAVALCFAAETESLVGAALLQGSLPLQPFPEIRNQLLFTVEPAWPRSLTLGVAFATRSAEHPLAPQLRPLDSLFTHTHAAAFPYRPLPKGELAPAPLITELLESERPLGLLHLLHDHRPGGLGESRFHRGALWVAPIDVTPSLQP